jgi:hypothetical protein
MQVYSFQCDNTLERGMHLLKEEEKYSNRGKPVDWLISINLIGRHFEPQPIRDCVANELRYSADDC